MLKLIGIIRIALSLIMVCGLATGCAVPSAKPAPNITPAPPATEEALEPYSLNKYTLLENDLPQDMRSIMLKTVERWEGDSSREIEFTATKSPWVVNAGYTPTSQISTEFRIFAYGAAQREQPVKQAIFGYEETEAPFMGVYSLMVEGTGDYIIYISASGCDWWAKVGVE